MPKPFPVEFRRDAVAVARKHEAPISQIAKEFGISDATLHHWLKKADIEDGTRPGLTSAEASELRDARKRIRLLVAKRTRFCAGQESIGEATEPRMCAGWDYADLLTGRTDYLLFSRTHAWDHAPGAAIVREAGFAVRRIDGSEYMPGVQSAPLLTAPIDLWDDVAAAIAPAFLAERV